MNSSQQNPIRRRDGSALLMTLSMSGIALLVLAGAMTWSASNTKQIER